MAEATDVGKLVEGWPDRDAIHIAIVPLEAGEQLYRGSPIKLAWGTLNIALDAECHQDQAIGIVDPFLRDDNAYVEKGERFWCFLFPGKVTGMRHHWQHPAFIEKPANTDEHETWIRRFADAWGFDYNALIEAAISTGEWRYAIAQGRDLHSREELGADHDLFWFHLEALTGQTFDQFHREGMGWSCSC